MNCVSILEMVATGTSPRDPVVSSHVGVCSECRSRVEAAQALGDRLRDPLLWEDPPLHLADEVVQAVAGESMVHRRRPRWWLMGTAALFVVIVAALTLMGRSDWTVELTAGPTTDGATAVVSGWNVDQGTRMVLEVEGLEPADPDRYYELWLTAPDGRHVSAGTFQGPGRIEVTAAVRRSEFPRLWVTYEPAQEEGAEFGETVLDTPRPAS